MIRVVTRGLIPEQPQRTWRAWSFVNVTVAMEIDFDKPNIFKVAYISFASSPTSASCILLINGAGDVSSIGSNTIRLTTNNPINIDRCQKYVHGNRVLQYEMSSSIRIKLFYFLWYSG
jgi:hypothetical protein